jgi:hypothetical protein
VPEEEIIVLASSRKTGGRCIAGVSTDSGKWVRPVSCQGEGELYPFHYEVRGRAPEALDIVCFSYDRPLEDPTQPENVLIDEEGWQLTGQLDPAAAYNELAPFLDPSPELFGNRERSLSAIEAARGVSESLVLIEPSDLQFSVRPPFEPGGPRRKRAKFSIGGQLYDLPITDFAVGPKLLSLENGDYGQDQLGLASDNHTLMTVSLGGEKMGRHWKLVATFLSLP